MIQDNGNGSGSSRNSIECQTEGTNNGLTNSSASVVSQSDSPTTFSSPSFSPAPSPPPLTSSKSPKLKERASARRPISSDENSNKVSPLSIVRIFAAGDGNINGRSWTIAVSSYHTAKEVAVCIENLLALPVDSLQLYMLCIMSEGWKQERRIEDDECLTKVKARLLGKQVPFFFLKEKTESIDVKALPRPVLSQRQPIPADFKRHSSNEHVFKSAFENTKRNSLPIFVGESMSSDYSSDTESDDYTESPEDPSIDITNAESWAPEATTDVVATPCSAVNWIKAEELVKMNKIGEGSFAKVYRGAYNNNIVAIKILKGLATEEQLASFKKEFEVLSLTSSPSLIRFYGASIVEQNENSLLSMVFSYCEKGSLSQVLNNKNFDFDWPTFFRWTYQALVGVNGLHNLQPPLVHRDLKTQNLLLDSNWNIKVADFGLARTMTMTHASSLGHLRGTMAYCAPEIYDGQIFSTKGDVYSMAIVMWEMVTRCITGRYHSPYHEYTDIQHPFQLIIKTSKYGIRPTIHPKTPQILKELLMRCWDASSAARPTCSELVLMISNIYTHYKVNSDEWDALRENVGT